jgi:hypothetical protein
MNDLQSLASDVLAMFDAQKEYFKTKNPEQLTRCKQIESALKARCKAILNPSEKPKPSLFGE